LLSERNTGATISQKKKESQGKGENSGGYVSGTGKKGKVDFVPLRSGGGKGGRIFAVAEGRAGTGPKLSAPQ